MKGGDYITWKRKDEEKRQKKRRRNLSRGGELKLVCVTMKERPLERKGEKHSLQKHASVCKKPTRSRARTADKNYRGEKEDDLQGEKRGGGGSKKKGLSVIMEGFKSEKNRGTGGEREYNGGRGGGG